MVDKFLRESLLGKRVVSPDIVSVIREIARTMYGGSTMEDQKKKHGITERTETASFDIPRHLGPEALRITDKLMKLNDHSRGQLYDILSASESGHAVLHVAERSLFQVQQLKTDAEHSREIASMRLYQLLRRFAHDLRILLSYCDAEGRQGPRIHLRPPADYPEDAVERIAENFPKYNVSTVFLSEEATINSDLPMLDNLRLLFTQLRTIQTGTNDDRRHITREIREIERLLHESPLLRFAQPAESRQMTDLLVELRRITHASAGKEGKNALREKRRGIVDTLTSVTAKEIAPILSALHHTGKFQPELDALDATLWKEMQNNPRQARLLLQTRWQRCGTLSPRMTDVLLVLSQEWQFDQVSETQRTLQITTPVRYSPRVLEEARAIYAGFTDASREFDQLNEDEHLGINSRIIADVVRLHTGDFPEEKRAPDTAHDEPAASVATTGGQTPLDTVPEPETIDPAYLVLASTAIRTVGLPEEDPSMLASVTQHSRPLEKVGDRFRRFLSAVETLDRRVSATAGLENLHSVVDGAVMQVTHQFSQVVQAITRSCRLETDTRVIDRGTDTLTVEEESELRRLIALSCLQLHSLFQSLPAYETGYSGTLHETTMDTLLAGTAQHLVATRMDSQWGRRLRRFPNFTEHLSTRLEEIGDEIWTTLEQMDDENDPFIESFRKALSTLIPALQETLLHIKNFDAKHVPDDFLKERLEQAGIPLGETAADGEKQPAPVTMNIHEGNPQRRLIAKYIRYHFHDTRGRISFEKVREFVAPAGIVAEEWNTEHPWYFVCKEEGVSGRAAVSNRFLRNGFHSLDIVHILFQYHEFRGIGNVQALIDSLPPKWLEKHQQEELSSEE